MTVATPPVPVPPSPRSILEDLYRFSVAQYHQLTQIGVLDQTTRTELLAGWIVDKMTHNPSHDATVDRLAELFRDRVPKPWRIRVQSAITTPDSEPEPDLVIAEGPADRYNQRHPGPADIQILVEVADTSLDRDRKLKAAVYARAGVSCYWIVSLPDSIVEAYTLPTGPAAAPQYQKLERFGLQDSVPLTVAGQALPPIPVKEILP